MSGSMKLWEAAQYSVARGARCCSARVFDRSFDGSSFDTHEGPVRCCRAVPLVLVFVRLRAQNSSHPQGP
jgi:hypothetical protein